MRIGYNTITNGRNLPKTEEMKLALANGMVLDDTSLLTIILSRIIDGERARNLAGKMLCKFKRLSRILHASQDEILEVEGTHMQVVLELAQTQHLLKAISRSNISHFPLLDRYEAVLDFCVGIFAETKREEFHVLFLNKRCELIHCQLLQAGTVDHVTVYPREVLRLALDHAASFIILVHNHPFGVAEPSRADIAMTQQLNILGNGLGMKILDHIIIGQNVPYSFRQNGKIDWEPGVNFPLKQAEISNIGPSM